MSQVEYITDDRDLEQRNKLCIYHGDNGDWYVATCGEDEIGIGKAVRFCTSGGASHRCPGLTTAIADAYRAIEANREVI